MLQDKRKRKQLLFSYGVFIMNGMLALSIGSLLPFIRDARGLEYAFCGMIVSLHSVGNLISSFAAGALPVFIGRKKSILLFNSFYALAFMLLIFGKATWCVAVAFFITGLARGATSNFCNTMVNAIAPGKAAIINGLHAMFAIGAFTFPLLLTAFTANQVDNWVLACYFMLGMGILSWILYFLIPVEQDSVKKEKKGGGFGFFREPLFYLCIVTLFFYLCAEQGVIGWMVTYFQDSGFLSASLAQMTASILWVMILAGRLLAAFLTTRIAKEKLLPVMGIGLVVFFVVLILSRNTALILLGIMGFGFSMAGIYPTTVSFSGKLIAKYPLAWSFILTCASLGSILMPTIIGAVAETAGIVFGMSTVAVAIVIDLGCIVALCLYSAKKQMKVHDK